MTWLLVLAAWTACAGVVAPVVGRVLAHDGLAPHATLYPAARRALPTPRSPWVLR